ncbi:MAG: lipoyl(octanoyl) transferase LipB [Gemmatimonadales bacterium]|jgi:lipoate-protein ligase B
MIHVVPVAGRVPYRAGLAWQRVLARARIDGKLDRDLVLLLEHAPVVTLGRGAADGNVTATAAQLREAGVDRVDIERGGDVTYHGPGQLVGYPIIDLQGFRKDLHWYLRRLEDVLIVALGALEIEAFRVPDYTGVWVGDPAAAADPVARAAGEARKIASIGVHVSRWVTWHGFALNLTAEAVEGFRWIVPCGIDQVRMTCIEAEGGDARLEAVRPLIAGAFGAAFETPAELEAEVEAGGHLTFTERVA